MECKNCRNDLFKISTISECEGCINNGEWSDSDGYVYPIESAGTQVMDEGECRMGTSYGDGCYIFKCNKCGEITHLATKEG